jgi:hypothetical protein
VALAKQPRKAASSEVIGHVADRYDARHRPKEVLGKATHRKRAITNDFLRLFTFLRLTLCNSAFVSYGSVARFGFQPFKREPRSRLKRR